MSIRAASLLILLVVFAGTATAATFTLPVPNEGWHFSFDMPPLAAPQTSKKPDGFAFRGNAERFNISVFVEAPSGTGTTHRDCYNYYWPLAQRNPMIVKSTIAVTEKPTFVRVQYELETEFQGQKIRQRSVNYYIAWRGKWIDVHISIIAPEADDQKIFDAFDAGLA
ncbi:MAG: hypothetical protein JWO97_3092, partial [Acidobacteria bacterium]|nr:hypothetical protein [Acidobacteriota bacterium]